MCFMLVKAPWVLADVVKEVIALGKALVASFVHVMKSVKLTGDELVKRGSLIRSWFIFLRRNFSSESDYKSGSFSISFVLVLLVCIVLCSFCDGCILVYTARLHLIKFSYDFQKKKKNKETLCSHCKRETGVLNSIESYKTSNYVMFFLCKTALVR